MGKADHYYAEMLRMMREQCKKDNPTTLQLGIMQSSNSAKINDLVLDADDLYIATHLVGTLVYGDYVVLQQLHNSNLYVILEKVVRA